MDTTPRVQSHPCNGSEQVTRPCEMRLSPTVPWSGGPSDQPKQRTHQNDPHEAKVALLRAVPLFGDLAPEALSRIADRSTWIGYQRRQAIHLPGDPADALYVVRQGRVKISRLSEDGKEATLTLVGAGEPFGEGCLLEANTRETIAEALESTQILWIPREELVPAVYTSPVFAMALARLMSGRRDAAESRLEEMVFKTVRGRLAGLLARLARSHGRPAPGGILLDLSLAHHDLADQIGSSRETTTLTLNQFKRMGFLRIDHCRILVRDVAALEGIA